MEQLHALCNNERCCRRRKSCDRYALKPSCVRQLEYEGLGCHTYSLRDTIIGANKEEHLVPGRPARARQIEATCLVLLDCRAFGQQRVKLAVSPPFVTVNPLIGCVATSFIVRVTVTAFDGLATSESSNPAVAATPKRAYFDFIVATPLGKNSASRSSRIGYSEQGGVNIVQKIKGWGLLPYLPAIRP